MYSGASFLQREAENGQKCLTDLPPVHASDKTEDLHQQEEEVTTSSHRIELRLMAGLVLEVDFGCLCWNEGGGSSQGCKETRRSHE